MNIVYLSPHFPPNYWHFCDRLRQLGATVLGIAEAPYDSLRPELRKALTEYYRVQRMDDWDQVLRAMGYFTHRYGKLDRVESHNEHWIELEAWLREHFNIPGKRIAETEFIKRKSMMKRKFTEAGVDVAPGIVVHSLDQARGFVEEVGFPVIAKPDKGVGAAATYRIDDHQALVQFFAAKPPLDYFMEGFIQGRIVTFDGLTDQNGNIVFFTSLEYSRNIMEVVNEDDHVHYWSVRHVDEHLTEAGFNSVAKFDIHEKFFHFEFFRTADGGIKGLELNLRPPGGFTTDMFNYANDIDVYREWANVVVKNRFESPWSRPYYCMYVGRKHRFRYTHSRQEVVDRFRPLLVWAEDMPPVFSRAMGDYAFIARSPDLDELHAMAGFIHAREE